jgi:hypothetical protein
MTREGTFKAVSEALRINSEVSILKICRTVLLEIYDELPRTTYCGTVPC